MKTEETIAMRLRRIASDLAQVERRGGLAKPVSELRKLADLIDRAEQRKRPGVQGHGTD